MSAAAVGAGGRAVEKARVALHARLSERRPEIEQEVMTRIYAISDPREVANPEYAQGLRAAVPAALDYAFEAIKRGEEHAPAPPPALLAQARLAARNGIGLDTVLRRYLAGYALLGDFLTLEAEREELLRGAGLVQLMRGQAAVFDRLLTAVSEEHGRESRTRTDSTERRRAERVERLLAGEAIDTSGLAYELGAHHTGLVAAGPGAGEVLGELATALDRRLLLVRRAEETAWAWLGGRRPLDPEELVRSAQERLPGGLRLAAGEPGQGLAGWRLTHRQAAAALPVALRRGDPLVRYADVALLAAALQDDLLATSLHELYLGPLERERDGGAAARETLRAYFAADRNVTSAAAALGVKRHTVTQRLRGIEAKVGWSISARAVELEAALRLQDLRSTRHRPD